MTPPQLLGSSCSHLTLPLEAAWQSSALLTAAGPPLLAAGLPGRRKFQSILVTPELAPSQPEKQVPKPSFQGPHPPGR